jgi:hypothetical protein
MADFFIHGFETTYFEPKALAQKQAVRIKQADLLLSDAQSTFQQCVFMLKLLDQCCGRFQACLQFLPGLG